MVIICLAMDFLSGKSAACITNYKIYANHQHMKRTITILLILIFIQSCIDNKKSKSILIENTVTKKIDTIHYGIQGFNSGVTLALLSDSTFFYKVELWGCTGGGEEKYIFGKFNQISNKIKLTPKNIKVLEYWNEEDPFNYENPVIQEFTYIKDSVRIKTEYYKINLGKESYLLSEENKGEFFADESKSNDFEELASHLKKDNKIYGKYFTTFTKDSVEFNIEQIPLKWRRLFK